MEGLTLYYTKLKKLRDEAKRLASNAVYLANLLAEEAKHLHWKDEASRLEALRSSILQQLEQERRREDSHCHAHSTGTLAACLIGFGVGATIKALSKDKRLAALADHLLTNSSSEEPPFRNVLVYIGTKGIPDDVGVASVSKLARESNREESQVVNELNERGYFLLPEDTFFLLMDKLINHVREGQVLLPVSLEKLFEIRTLGTG